MSSVEAGMVGVWSCLYCEGAWIPSAASTKVIEASERSDSKPGGTALGMDSSHEEQALLCPECSSAHHARRGSKGKELYACQDCQSLFLPKGSVCALSESLGGRSWELHQVIAQLFTGSTIAKADEAITVAALLYLLLS